MWNEVRLKGYLPPLSSTDHLSCVVLTVSEPTEAEFTLFQEGQRQINLLIFVLIKNVNTFFHTYCF